MKIFSDFLILILTFKEKLTVTEKNTIDGEEISDTENETICFSSRSIKYA